MIYDISSPISEALAVWPGDMQPRREVARRGDVTSSSIHTTVHVGTHADAPGHMIPGERGIDQQDLELYVGPCQVIRIEAARGSGITPDMLAMPIEAPRVLLATGTYPDSTSFNEDFAAPTPELIDLLAAEGVRLLGVDTPSVDLFTAEGVPVHLRVFKHDMALLEVLRLEGVPAGLYELIALPLRLEGFDASPVRAILRTL